MLKLPRSVFIAGLSLALAGSMAFGDVVHLKDGRTIEGAVKHTDEGWIVRTSDNKTIRVAPIEVDSIELTPTTNPSPRVAGEHLASLRRSVEGLSDLNDIIARFQRFVDQSIDPAATADAKKDLAMWQDRLKQKMVKVGTKWVTPADRDLLVIQAGASAETARQLLKQGRAKEAAPLLADAVAVDPQNPTALYLNSLLNYQQEQLVPARKGYETVAGIIPNHAPTLNNLAVILWRQHQYIPALQNFDAAMLADPVEKIILDNVAVAFQTLPIDLQKSPVTQKALQHFNEQDQKLAEIMSHNGMHRFGSLWVSDKDIDQLKAQDAIIQGKLDALAQQFDQSKQRADLLTDSIGDSTAEMHRIEASSYVTDPRSGSLISVPYPSSYYDLQRDIQRQTRDRDAELSRLDALKKQAQDLQNSRPSQHNLGVLQVIGPEGAPLKVAIAPTAQPIAK
jgi:tetratricopeptide (TPR) repeat protein